MLLHMAACSFRKGPHIVAAVSERLEHLKADCLYGGCLAFQYEQEFRLENYCGERGTVYYYSASKKMDYFIKLFQYRTVGVREYWIVDPDRELVTVYQFEAETMEPYSFGEEVPVGIYEGFGIKLQQS